MASSEQPAPARKRAPRKAAPRKPAAPKYGATETAVRADLKRLPLADDGPTLSLCETAYLLARTLDAGAGLSTAAVSRELRATLAALMIPKETDGDSPLDELIAALSAPMGDTAGH
jgi:hypothetical protein